VRVTHPFHPLLGKTFELQTLRKTWGEDRVFFYENGHLRALPAGWTDAVEPLVFVSLAAGRAYFRPDDLLRLAELVDSVRGSGKARRSVASEAPQAGNEASTKFRRASKAKDAASPKARQGSPKRSPRSRTNKCEAPRIHLPKKKWQSP
jgi:hypothetical protein